MLSAPDINAQRKLHLRAIKNQTGVKTTIPWGCTIIRGVQARNRKFATYKFSVWLLSVNILALVSVFIVSF